MVGQADIQTLSSFLTGQKVFRPVVDLVLKALGTTTAVALVVDAYEATTPIVGLGCVKPLYFGDLLCSLKNFGVQQVKLTLAELVDFVSGKLLQVKFCFEPTGK